MPSRLNCSAALTLPEFQASACKLFPIPDQVQAGHTCTIALFERVMADLKVCVVAVPSIKPDCRAGHRLL